MVRKLAAFAIFLVVGIILLGSATGVNVPPKVAAQTQNVNVGNLRMVNALVGIGPVDMFLDNTLVASTLQPKDATPYYFVPAGSHELTVRRVNADPLSIPIADTLVDIAPNSSVTAIAYEKVFLDSTNATNAPTDDQAGAFFLMNDDRSPIELGRARLEAAHLAVSNPQRISIGYRSGEALLYQIGLEQPFGSIDVNAGIQTLAVIDADSPSLNLLANFGDYSFNSSTLYTLVVVPNVVPPPDPNTKQVVAAATSPQMFIISAPLDPPQTNGLRLRIIHAAHDTSVLDIYIDQRLVARRFSYGQYTQYLGLADYGHTITIRRYGDPDSAAPLGQATFTITPANQSQINWTLLLVNQASTPGTNASATAIPPTAQPTQVGQIIQNGTAVPADEPDENVPVVINTPGGQVVASILPDNISATQRDFARVRVINAADGVQSVGLYTPAYPYVAPPPNAKPTPTPIPTPGAIIPPITLTDPVLFGAEANDREVPTGLYTQLNFLPDGGRTTLKQLLNQQLVSGVVYTYVMMGSPAGNPPLQVITLEDYGTGIPIERTYLGTVTGTVNVRSAPNSNAPSVGKADKTVQISVLGRSANNQWLRVRYQDPVTGVRIDGWLGASAGIKITRLGTPVTVAVLPIYNGP